MKAYCGQTRQASLVARLAAAGIGECTVRGELKSRRRDPWFYDNGAYRDWQAGRAFDGVQFARDMRRVRYDADMPLPDFVVVPDVVAGGLESLALSRRERGELGHPGELRHPPAYLAVQDGMTVEGVGEFMQLSAEIDGYSYEGVFVGGTLDWKLATSAEWVRFARDTGRRCHIGRVGTPDRIRWAHAIGADSIDSCLPLMYEEHLVAFLSTLETLSC